MMYSAYKLNKQGDNIQPWCTPFLIWNQSVVPCPVWITTNWKILKDMGIPDHLICLLRNLYAGQEATVRTGHGTTDWFQIGKGVHQACILSPCLFNLYADCCCCCCHFSRVDSVQPPDGSLPGSPVPGILQARTLEWLPFPSSMHEREKWKWSHSVVSDSSRPHGRRSLVGCSPRGH